jgi:hypothetical protein
VEEGWKEEVEGRRREHICTIAVDNMETDVELPGSSISDL